ncbi:MAG: molybdopterin cofactor-binding domain-containing protein [Reyranellaceae bacterium]
MSRKLSRRRLLKILGWSGAGITAMAAGAYALMPALPSRRAPAAADAAAWVSLRPEGHFELHSPRVEMGQGIAVALRQVVAEELGVSLAQVRCLSPDTAVSGECRATVGSDSIKDFAPLLAQAAAALALALQARAAAMLQAPEASLDAAGAAAASGRRLTFAELAAGPPLVLDDRAVAAATPRSFAADHAPRIVGHGAPTDGIAAIVTGNAPLFADDIRLPGMIHGAMVKSEGLNGTVAALDDSGARTIPGYLGLVSGRGFTGLLAARRGALQRALAAIAFEDSYERSVSTASIEAAIGSPGGKRGHEHVLHPAAIDPDRAFDIDLRLAVPLAAHASIEPRTAVADFRRDGKLEIWTGTQDAFFVRDTLAKALGMARSEVVVHGMRVGGGFGARTICAAELEAALLSRAARRPVKVQWSRADEFRHGFHRPPSTHRIRAALDEGGRIARWWHAFRSGHVIFTSAAMGPVLQFGTSFVADPGVARGSTPPYAVGALRVEFDDVRLPVKTGPWRGLGAAGNCWAIETAIDALARKAGLNAVAFRLRNLPAGAARLAEVLRRAAAMARWDGRSRQEGVGYGVACGTYKEMSHAAAIARIERHGGRLRLSHLWCAQDCGRVVNPDQVRAQVEGNLVWGIGMALGETLDVAEGRISAQSFLDYAIPRFSDVPQIAIELVEGSPVPTGAGETAIVCATAAVTNAIADLDGESVLALPWRAR